MNRVSETIVGTKGVAESSGVITDRDNNVIYKHRDKNDPNPYQVEHNKLYQSIRQGGVINNLEYGAKSTMTAILGRYATYSGKVITWEDALNSSVQLMPAVVSWEDTPPVVPDKNGFYPVAIPGKTKVV
jgi:hypothetical protein